MDDLPRMDRRKAIKWMLTAAAAVSMPTPPGFSAVPPGSGYGTDPNLMETYKPGELWPLTLSPTQRQTVALLCDVILPADSRSPSASELHVHDFIDEWISAPYPRQQRGRKVILEGLAWLEKESDRRFHRGFTALTNEQRTQICDDICFEPKAAAKFKSAAHFFNAFRELTMNGFYSTPEGWKDLQYIGNVALPTFDGPPPEVLKYLKLDA
jgi:hypothetical protein